jgi:branched-chain amino acid transport system permease protein
VGISLSRASLLSFLIAGCVGAIGGVLASPIYFTGWESGLTLGLKGFVAATLGGLVSVRGAVLGGLLLGVLENLTAGYVSTGLRDAVAFFLLIVVLVARPSGIFGRTAEARV